MTGDVVAYACKRRDLKMGRNVPHEAVDWVTTPLALVSHWVVSFFLQCVTFGEQNSLVGHQSVSLW
jgi:hypothetical protein